MSSFENQLQEATQLISLPEVYLKVNRLMDDPTSDIDDFARVIQLDPNLSAKLLKSVNSAYYGFSGEISSIARAVQLVGIQQLHVMVLSISAISAVASLTFPKDIVDFRAFWRSSLLTGTLAKLLAQDMRIRSAERFFVLGLLHEIGHLVLYANFPDKARQTIQLSVDQGISINQAEQQMLGCHYGIIGAKLMKQWKLPTRFQDLTSLQPTPELATDAKEEAALLHIAHAYAHHQFIDTDKSIEEMVHPIAWDQAGLPAEKVEDRLSTALAASEELENIILRNT